MDFEKVKLPRVFRRLRIGWHLVGAPRGAGPGLPPKPLLSSARHSGARAGASPARARSGLPRGRDVWLEVIDAARVSFAPIALILPESTHPYSGGPRRASFNAVFGPPASRGPLLSSITAACLADAVYNTALSWVDIWKRVSK